MSGHPISLRAARARRASKLHAGALRHVTDEQLADIWLALEASGSRDAVVVAVVTGAALEINVFERERLARDADLPPAMACINAKPNFPSAWLFVVEGEAMFRLRFRCMPLAPGGTA